MWILSLSDVTDNEWKFLNLWKTLCNSCTALIRNNITTILQQPHTVFSSQSDFSILDFTKIKFNSENELIDFLRDNLWLRMNNKNWFEQFNQLYRYVVEFYESRYLRKLPVTIKNKRFNNIKQIFSFLQHTWMGTDWIYKCEIAKYFFIYVYTCRNEIFKNLPEIHKDFVQRIKFSIQINSDDWENDYSKWSFSHDWSSSDIDLFSRQKSMESIIWKQMSSTKYWSVDKINDLVAITLDVEVNNKSDLIFLLQQLYMSWNFELDDLMVRSKRILSTEHVEEIWVNLDSKFKTFLFAQLAYIEKGWKWTPLEYQDLKFKWKMKYTIKSWRLDRILDVWVEIKIVLRWNNNEYWIKFHPIYDYKKRLRELTRMWSYVRLNDILNYVNDFFLKLDDNLKYKQKNKFEYLLKLFTDLQKRWFIDESYIFNIENPDLIKILSKALFLNFISELMPVKQSPKSKKIYFVHPSYIERLHSWIVQPVSSVDISSLIK